jgi:acyl-CoA thioesterase-1
VDGGQPPEAARNLLLEGRIARPHVQAPRPERFGKPAVFQTNAGVFERAIEWPGIDREGHRATMRLMYMGMPRILRSLVIALPVVAVACAQPDAPPSYAAAVQPAASAQAASQASRNLSRPRIVFLGDSLTAGLGLPREQAVPSLIQARLDAEGYGYEVVNAGVSGDTSAGGVRRLDWALDGDVDVLVVELGANDGLRGLPVAQMKRNLHDIVTRAKERGIMVILTGMEAPPNYGPLYTSEFRKAFRDLADEHDVAFVPFFLEGVAGNPALNNADGLHPNADGARIIEQTLWRALEPVIEKQSR